MALEESCRIVELGYAFCTTSRVDENVCVGVFRLPKGVMAYAELVSQGCEGLHPD